MIIKIVNRSYANTSLRPQKFLLAILEIEFDFIYTSDFRGRLCIKQYFSVKTMFLFIF
jgi:hypothetical protein